MPASTKFSTTVGTVFERSKIPLHKWLLATHLMTASKKGISAHQLHRVLGITYKSSWFMAHRICEAMRNDNPTPVIKRGLRRRPWHTNTTGLRVDHGNWSALRRR